MTWNMISYIFQVISRSNKWNPGQLGFELMFVLIMYIWQMSFFFCKWHLERWIWKHWIYKFISRLWLKIPGFPHFFSNFQAFSRPGKINDKIPGFKFFPGGVGPLGAAIVCWSRPAWWYKYWMADIGSKGQHLNISMIWSEITQTFYITLELTCCGVNRWNS